MRGWIEFVLGYFVIVALAGLFVLALVRAAAQLYAGSS